MSLTNFVRTSIMSLTGYWIYKRKHLPVGTDLFEDIVQKINIPIKNIFDVGANIGLTSNKYQSVFKNAHVFAFEPIHNTFERLKINTTSNKNIECYNIAFGEKKETVEIKLFEESRSYLNSLKPNAMNQNDSARIEKIQVDTIDEFMNVHKNINSIDFLKIDTEGFEIQVLKGARETINSGKIKMIYLEIGFSKTNHRNTYYPEAHDFLDSNGFSFYGMYDVKNKEIGIKYHYANALFIHDSVTKIIRNY